MFSTRKRQVVFSQPIRYTRLLIVGTRHACRLLQCRALQFVPTEDSACRWELHVEYYTCTSRKRETGFLIRWDRYPEVFVIAKGQSAAKFCVATHCVPKIFYIVTFSEYPSLSSWERYLWWVNSFFPCLSLKVIVLWLFGLVLKSLTFGVYLANHEDFLVGNCTVT